jgi:hypothetical protein
MIITECTNNCQICNTVVAAHTLTTCTHCGKQFCRDCGTSGYNKVARCQGCNEQRQALLTSIHNAISGVAVKKIYISMTLRNLISIDDFSVEVSYRKQERMIGDFLVVEE